VPASAISFPSGGRTVTPEQTPLHLFPADASGRAALLRLALHSSYPPRRHGEAR
jgi:hypothetical protein